MLRYSITLRTTLVLAGAVLFVLLSATNAFAGYGSNSSGTYGGASGSCAEAGVTWQATHGGVAGQYGANNAWNDFTSQTTPQAEAAANCSGGINPSYSLGSCNSSTTVLMMWMRSYANSSAYPDPYFNPSSGNHLSWGYNSIGYNEPGYNQAISEIESWAIADGDKNTANQSADYIIYQAAKYAYADLNGGSFGGKNYSAQYYPGLDAYCVTYSQAGSPPSVPETPPAHANCYQGPNSNGVPWNAYYQSGGAVYIPTPTAGAYYTAGHSLREDATGAAIKYGTVLPTGKWYSFNPNPTQIGTNPMYSGGDGTYTIDEHAPSGKVFSENNSDVYAHTYDSQACHVPTPPTVVDSSQCSAQTPSVQGYFYIPADSYGSDTYYEAHQVVWTGPNKTGTKYAAYTTLPNNTNLYPDNADTAGVALTEYTVGVPKEAWYHSSPNVGMWGVGYLSWAMTTVVPAPNDCVDYYVNTQTTTVSTVPVVSVAQGPVHPYWWSTLITGDNDPYTQQLAGQTGKATFETGSKAQTAQVESAWGKLLDQTTAQNQCPTAAQESQAVAADSTAKHAVVSLDPTNKLALAQGGVMDVKDEATNSDCETTTTVITTTYQDQFVLYVSHDSGQTYTQSMGWTNMPQGYFANNENSTGGGTGHLQALLNAADTSDPVDHKKFPNDQITANPPVCGTCPWKTVQTNIVNSVLTVADPQLLNEWQALAQHGNGSEFDCSAISGSAGGDGLLTDCSGPAGNALLTGNGKGDNSCPECAAYWNGRGAKINTQGGYISGSVVSALLPKDGNGNPIPIWGIGGSNPRDTQFTGYYNKVITASGQQVSAPPASEQNYFTYWHSNDVNKGAMGGANQTAVVDVPLYAPSDSNPENQGLIHWSSTAGDGTAGGSPQATLTTITRWQGASLDPTGPNNSAPSNTTSTSFFNLFTDSSQSTQVFDGSQPYAFDAQNIPANAATTVPTTLDDWALPTGNVSSRNYAFLNGQYANCSNGGKCLLAAAQWSDENGKSNSFWYSWIYTPNVDITIPTVNVGFGGPSGGQTYQANVVSPQIAARVMGVSHPGGADQSPKDLSAQSYQEYIWNQLSSGDTDVNFLDGNFGIEPLPATATQGVDANWGTSQGGWNVPWNGDYRFTTVRFERGVGD